jgi:hypothetical protein
LIPFEDFADLKGSLLLTMLCDVNFYALISSLEPWMFDLVETLGLPGRRLPLLTGSVVQQQRAGQILKILNT